MRLLAFQNTPGEPPAAFSRHASAAGDTVHIVRLCDGGPIPDGADFDALIVMGGPMDVWEEDAYPWLAPEKTAIRNWVTTGKPFLGICLGHQLLVEAMGGTCRSMQTPEIAVSDVTRLAADDPLLAALPDHFPAMHWHGVEADALPDNTCVLARSAGCDIQAVRVDDNAWGLQFHPELEHGTVTKWMDDKGNIDCATDWLGSTEAAWDFVKQSEARADSFLETSGQIYQAFRTRTLAK